MGMVVYSTFRHTPQDRHRATKSIDTRTFEQYAKIDERRIWPLRLLTHNSIDRALVLLVEAELTRFVYTFELSFF